MPVTEQLRARLEALRSLTPQQIMAGGAELATALGALAAPIDGYRAPAVATREELIPGPHGDFRVRIYGASTPGASHRALVWMHGGGFARGDIDMAEADVVAREIWTRANMIVISVDYHLAVDGIHFPVLHDDVIAAWHWAVDSSTDLGIDLRRLDLGGASAGANLAAGAALRLRDEGAVTPARLLLAYPVLHFEIPEPITEPPSDLGSIPLALQFPPDLIEAVNANYLGAQEPTPYAFPAMADPKGLPATVILTSEYDPLRPSGEVYAQMLAAAGVSVTLRCEPGVPHGHLNIPGLSANEGSLRFLLDSLLDAD